MRRLTVTLLLAVLLAFASTAQAGDADHAESVVQIVCKTRGPLGLGVMGAEQFGTGVLVWSNGSQGLVLTAAHVTDGCATPGVIFANGSTFQGRSLGRLRGHDLAGLVVPVPPGAKPLPIATETPSAGQTATIYGHRGGSRQVVVFPLRVRGYSSGRDGLAEIVLEPGVGNGDSGGPVVFNGAVVGLVSGGRVHTAGVAGNQATDSRGPAANAMQRFAKYAAPWSCGPGGCVAPSPTRQLVEPIYREPARTTRPTRPAVPIATTPPASIDYARVLDLMARDGRFKGADGTNGDNGLPAIIDYKALADVLAADGRFTPGEIDYARLLADMSKDPRFSTPPPPVLPPPVLPASPPHAFAVTPPAAPAATPATPPESTAKAATRETPDPWAWLLQIGATAALTAAGVSVPWYVAYAAKKAAPVVVEAARRRRRRRPSAGTANIEPEPEPRQDLADENGGPRGRRVAHPSPQIITTEHPPAPQAVIPTTEFVDVENDRTARALPWAVEQAAKRFPGQRAALESVLDLVEQHRNAQER